tara:strand:- start:6 stop:716 length:711 start_codon:yes stop_codon:yes gene_type:complete
MNNRILLLLFLCFSFNAKSQNNKTTFGVQYKPIIPAAYFNASDIDKIFGFYNLNLNPKYSNSFGMVIRHKINKTFSVESGLNYTQRNFKLGIRNSEIGLDDFTNFNMRSYEIPVQVLTYVRASEYWYLNVAFGISYNVLASGSSSYGEKEEGYFYQNTYRKNGGYGALLANIGMECRTEEKGHYYIGTSLHMAWGAIGRIYPEYDDNTNIFNDDKEYYLDILGNFVTIDIRYFFAE